MKRVFSLVLASVAVASSYAQVSWSRDLAAAKKVAKKQNKLIFVDFFAEWCGPCKMMDQEVFKTSKGKALLKDFVAVKQDVDREGKTSAQQYRISAMPSLYVLDGDGKVVLYYVGGMDTEMLTRFLAEAKKNVNARNTPKRAPSKKKG
jgi:thiol:disulfide interchange protein